MSSTGQAGCSPGAGTFRVSSVLSSRAAFFTWLSYGLLLLQQGVDAWMQQAPWIVWVIKLLPLLLFLPGMLRDRLRSFIWVCFVCLLYFIVLVQRLFVESGSPLVIVGTVAVVTLFIASMLYVRWRAREWRAASEETTVNSGE